MGTWAGNRGKAILSYRERGVGGSMGGCGRVVWGGWGSISVKLLFILHGKCHWGRPIHSRLTSLSYVGVKEAVEEVSRLGPGALLAK